MINRQSWLVLFNLGQQLTFPLARSIECLFFCFLRQTNQHNDLFLLERLWKHGKKSMVSWKQLPIIAACSGFGWMFFMHRQGIYEWKLLSRKEKIDRKQFKFIFVSALFPAWLVPSTLPVWSLLFSSQLIRKIELIHSPRGHYLATIPLRRSQNNPRLEIGLISEIVSGINDLPAVGRRHRAKHEHYHTLNVENTVNRVHRGIFP